MVAADMFQAEPKLGVAERNLVEQQHLVIGNSVPVDSGVKRDEKPLFLRFGVHLLSLFAHDVYLLIRGMNFYPLEAEGRDSFHLVGYVVPVEIYRAEADERIVVLYRIVKPLYLVAGQTRFFVLILKAGEADGFFDSALRHKLLQVLDLSRLSCTLREQVRVVCPYSVSHNISPFANIYFMLSRTHGHFSGVRAFSELRHKPDTESV